ncbi:flavodoxin family protein [Cytobacillus spongiae]|uniref:flavodoxin family protein n=1 Tax=Cytobacillus spongiae TaxID=2901381 RepID=UPI001F3206F1|nr:flavodoxin family protein [Cytobacillus spongiae]UII57576.1 flavodoxin family protein [Cytobacillus spongiae]
MKIAVLHGGTRPNGNTEALTKIATEGVSCEHIYLKDYHILPIIDQRHDASGFQERDDDYNRLLDLILPCDLLIFSTPIYWYSMSAQMKLFIDRWSQSLRDSNYPDFKKQMAAKKAYVLSVGGDDPLIKGLPMIQQFQHIFSFVGMEFSGYLIGSANQPGEIQQDERALLAAKQLNEQLRNGTLF